MRRGSLRIKRVSSTKEATSTRRRCTHGIWSRGVERGGNVPEARRRPFFTARTSVSGPRSPQNTNKNGGSRERLRGQDREARGGGICGRDTERKRKMGKDGNQVPRDTEGASRGGKRTIPRDSTTTTVVLRRPSGFFLSSFSVVPSSSRFPRVHVLRGI